MEYSHTALATYEGKQIEAVAMISTVCPWDMDEFPTFFLIPFIMCTFFFLKKKTTPVHQFRVVVASSSLRIEGGWEAGLMQAVVDKAKPSKG